MDSHFTFFDRSCSHELTNEIDGFLTCISCGLVIEHQVFESSVKKSDFNHPVLNDPHSHPLISNSKLSNSTPFFKQTQKPSKDIETLKEMLNRDLFSVEVFNLAHELILKWQKAKIPYKKSHLPYAVYFASKSLDFPINPRTLSKYLNIGVKEIFRLEKILPLKNDFSPIKYIFKFGETLKIKFKDLKKCESQCLKLSKNLCIQPVILATSIIVYNFPNIDIQFLCEISHVSMNTIKKWTSLFDELLQEN